MAFSHQNGKEKIYQFTKKLKKKRKRKKKKQKKPGKQCAKNSDRSKNQSGFKVGLSPFNILFSYEDEDIGRFPNLH